MRFLPNISLSENSLLRVERSMTEAPRYLSQGNFSFSVFVCGGQDRNGLWGGEDIQKQPVRIGA